MKTYEIYIDAPIELALRTAKERGCKVFDSLEFSGTGTLLTVAATSDALLDWSTSYMPRSSLLWFQEIIDEPPVAEDSPLPVNLTFEL